VYNKIQLHNYELHNFNSSKNIIRVTESRRISWVQHVDQIGERNNAQFCSENLKERGHLEDVVYMGGYFKMDFRNHNGMMWTGLI
jgi:hypothetical protein